MAARSIKILIFRWVATGVMLIAAALIFYAAGQPIDQGYTYRPVSDGSARPTAPMDPAADAQGETGRTEADHGDLLGLGLPVGTADQRHFDPILKPHPDGQKLYHTASPEDPPLIRTSVWSIPDAHLTDVASYYQQQALERGYDQRSQSEDPERKVIRSVLTQAEHWLTVRCRQAGQEVRVVLELRYTTTVRSP